MTVYKPTEVLLTHRHRRQASSHIYAHLNVKSLNDFPSPPVIPFLELA